MDFVAGSVVEVLSPVNRAIGSRDNVKGTSPTGNRVSLSELRRVRIERDNRSGNRAYNGAGGQDRQSVETIAKET